MIMALLGLSFCCVVIVIGKAVRSDRRLNRRLSARFRASCQADEVWEEVGYWQQYDRDLHGPLCLDPAGLSMSIAAPGAPATTHLQPIPYPTQRVRMDDGELGTVYRVDHTDGGARIFVALDRSGMAGYLDIPRFPSTAATTIPHPTETPAAHPVIRVGRFQAPPDSGDGDR